MSIDAYEWNIQYTENAIKTVIGEGNVALYAANNPFLCTLLFNKICSNQTVIEVLTGTSIHSFKGNTVGAMDSPSGTQ